MNIDSNTPDSWECQNSIIYIPEYRYLNIIAEARACHIISKGPKYSFYSNIDFWFP